MAGQHALSSFTGGCLQDRPLPVSVHQKDAGVIKAKLRGDQVHRPDEKFLQIQHRGRLSSSGRRRLQVTGTASQILGASLHRLFQALSLFFQFTCVATSLAQRLVETVDGDVQERCHGDDIAHIHPKRRYDFVGYQYSWEKAACLGRTDASRRDNGQSSKSNRGTAAQQQCCYNDHCGVADDHRG